MPDADSLHRFSPPVQRWFEQTFDRPTPPQQLGWPEIAAGHHTLICAPTGSGKTLAAFLWCLDELVRADATDEGLPQGIHTLYISPLKALGYDVERNLRLPLQGIRAACRDLGRKPPQVGVAVRTGDTTQSQRRAMLRKPPHLLITTPESLFILLTSKRALPLLSRVRYIVVDEVHALCGNKRGVSLTLSLERLVALGQRDPVRVGLSATVRPTDEAARFLGGYRARGAAATRTTARGRRLAPRPVKVVDGGRRKDPDLLVVAPVADFTQLTDDSVWPEVHNLLLDWIRRHRSTLVFVRMRAQAERVSRALNELAGARGGKGRRPAARGAAATPLIARAHHGSLARKVRRELEDELKEGKLPALLSTGTLELGIDVGAIDLVVQAGSPGAVSSGLQRVGRAGHLLTERSRGRLLPLYREDLVECTVIAGRMPENALDVLAQHLISTAAMGSATGDELLSLFRQAAPYHGLGRAAFDAVLELLAGRYPAEIARGLTAKLAWERTTDRVSALPGAARLAVTTGGTIPDQGYYVLSLPDGSKLGELEEEFVFERTVGDVIAFGAASWRILNIDRQRVTVARASGGPAVIPFWKGGLFGRDPELSEANGAFRRELDRRVARPAEAERWLRRRYPVDDWAAANLVRYFDDQRGKGAKLGTDRQVVLELFPDELGDHNLLVHSSFGNRLNAPWAMAIRARLRQRLGVDPQVVSDDNGILFRLPAGEEQPPLDLLTAVAPDELEELVTGQLRHSAMYGTLFRQNAARFLVLGTYGVGRRTPLWLQRLRAKDLQEATSDLLDFPVQLETVRECLQQMMDLPRLRSVLERIHSGEIRTVRQKRDTPSPVASGLLNRFIGQYMYEYDEPRAERSLRRLQLSRDLLDQVLGRDDAHELLLPRAAAELEEQWQGRSERTRARNADELLVLVYRQVVLAEDRLSEHCAEDVEPGALLAELLGDGRLSRFSLGEGTWVCASEDLPLLLRAHHPQRPRPVEPDREPELPKARPSELRQQLLLRVVDCLGPSTLTELQRRTGLSAKPLAAAVEALVRRGALRRGHFREGTDELLVCTPLNLEQIRRRSLGHARRQVEPVPLAVLQRFVVRHQLSHADLEHALEALALRPLPVEVLERDLLPARVSRYRSAQLDPLFSGGSWLWTGHGHRRLLLWPRASGGLPRPTPLTDEDSLGSAASALAEQLEQRGASFLGDLAAALPGLGLSELERGLWELVWSGRVTNDSFGTLRHALAAGFQAPSGRPAQTAINPFTGRPSRTRPRRPRLRPGAVSDAHLAGRWALVPPAPEPDGVDAELVVALLLRRYGIVTRELLEAETVVRWSAVYPALCQLEMAGELARGPFVEGLGPAQFAPSETVDQLRAIRQEPAGEQPLLLNSCDPTVLAVDPRAAVARRPTTYVVIESGEPVLVLETAGQLRLDTKAAPPRQRAWIAELRALLRRGFSAVRVSRVNGQSALKSPLRGTLEEAGYRADGKVLEIRRF